MRLYLLKPVVDWDPWYDTSDGFVVRAWASSQARELASKYAGDEGSAVWLDPKKTTCEVLKNVGAPGIVLKSFQAA